MGLLKNKKGIAVLGLGPTILKAVPWLAKAFPWLLTVLGIAVGQTATSLVRPQTASMGTGVIWIIIAFGVLIIVLLRK